MRRSESGFSVVDLLVILAILMILSAMILPHFAESRTKAPVAKSSHPVTDTRPAR
jgi:Tfp pilus assembly protein FimT